MSEVEVITASECHADAPVDFRMAAPVPVLFALEPAEPPARLRIPVSLLVPLAGLGVLGVLMSGFVLRPLVTPSVLGASATQVAPYLQAPLPESADQAFKSILADETFDAMALRHVRSATTLLHEHEGALDRAAWLLSRREPPRFNQRPSPSHVMRLAQALLVRGALSEKLGLSEQALEDHLCALRLGRVIRRGSLAGTDVSMALTSERVLALAYERLDCWIRRGTQNGPPAPVLLAAAAPGPGMSDAGSPQADWYRVAAVGTTSLTAAQRRRIAAEVQQDLARPLSWKLVWKVEEERVVAALRDWAQTGRLDRELTEPPLWPVKAMRQTSDLRSWRVAAQVVFPLWPSRRRAMVESLVARTRADFALFAPLMDMGLSEERFQSLGRESARRWTLNRFPSWRPARSILGLGFDPEVVHRSVRGRLVATLRIGEWRSMVVVTALRRASVIAACKVQGGSPR